MSSWFRKFFLLSCVSLLILQIFINHFYNDPIKGRVIDAMTNKPLSDISVGVFYDCGDSIDPFESSRSAYVACHFKQLLTTKTNINGEFIIPKHLITYKIPKSYSIYINLDYYDYIVEKKYLVFNSTKTIKTTNDSYTSILLTRPGYKVKNNQTFKLFPASFSSFKDCYVIQDEDTMAECNEVFGGNTWMDKCLCNSKGQFKSWEDYRSVKTILSLILSLSILGSFTIYTIVSMIWLKKNKGTMKKEFWLKALARFLIIFFSMLLFPIILILLPF